ncbi:MAG: UvrD-helicase domain-containing protein, partial [Cyclobacteriaceae bacterium]
MNGSDLNDSLVIYRSSAGSGKTYTLTREYLYLALRGGDKKAYRRILAVTFTNKAMQEMKDRIVSKLAQFASGDVLDSMAVDLIERLKWKEEKFISECATLLSSILHQYSHFAITTIDAFFQQIIRSFARELHISGGYRLELEQDLVYRQVIQDLMNEADSSPYVRKWLEDFSLSKLDSAKGWEVEKELLDFIKQLDSEAFRDIEKEVVQYDQDLYKQVRASCQSYIHRFENQLAEKGKKAISLIEQSGLTKKDFFGGHAANFLYYAVSGVYRTDQKKGPTKSFLKCIESGEWFKKKPDSETLPCIEKLEATDFQQIAEEINDLWNRGERDYRTAQAVYQNIYVFALSVSLLKKLSDFKKENDILFISDATRLIRELVENTDAPFIFEKVGSFFDHFLIDEFQDTSGFQWDSFRPLVDNSLAQGKVNLIVGDVKQSIYRWRGGDLELLQEKVEKEFSIYNPRIENLDTNYRSRRNIINFNNAVFSTIHSVL